MKRGTIHRGARLPLRGRGGFTLIELLAVIVIISILAYFLITNVFAAKETMEVHATRAKLGQIAAGIGEYSDETGDWPPSTFPETWGVAPDAVNLGGEVLYLTLCADGQPGQGTLDEDPCNTDGDATALRIPGHESLQLFEIPDAWGNPIAYFHHRDYDRKDVYVCFDAESGQSQESTVQARRNEKTGRWQAPRGFQLISAGPNGRFDVPGSEEDDDITHFGG